MLICSVLTSVINLIRKCDPLLLILIFLGLIIAGFIVFRKAIKVNYNPKKLESINMAWLLLSLIIFAIAIFMVAVYY